MNEITYYLGAGASCQSMPLVSNFNSRFSIFLDYMSKNKDGNVMRFCIIAKEFSVEIKNHYSFDTFFKKLFHLGKDDSILKFKKVLLVYFIFEHVCDDFSLLPFGDDLIKKESIEKRYDALIAGLLKPIKSKTEFFGKVNFVTWNYDLLLINSIRNFFYNNLNLHEVVSNLKVEDRKFKIRDVGEIIHLNGNIIHEKFKEIKILSDGELVDFMNSILRDFFHSNSEINEYANSIKFAWESLNSDFEQNNSIIKSVADIFKKSSIIVVIGYSFPLYNRLVDQELFKMQYLKNKTVYFQDINADSSMNSVAENFALQDLLPNSLRIAGLDRGTFKPINDCNGFYIPNNFYNAG